MKIQRGVLLSERCRFRVGGPADFFAQAAGPEELAEALRFGRDQGLGVFLFGAGTNLFFADAGFRGLVVQFLGGSWRLETEQGLVWTGGGVLLGDLVRELGRAGYGGLEFLGNIPGSVGGAVAGNAGCYGKSISRVLTQALLLDRERLEPVGPVGPEFLEFGYRASRLKREQRLVLLEACLAVVPRSPGAVLAEVEAELAGRRAKHPHDEPCAGSFFKNPDSLPAWRVITEAGLVGARVGDACLSPLHANFLINAGRATSAEILALTRLIRERVRERLGIDLAPEVRYVGPLGVEEMA